MEKPGTLSYTYDANGNVLTKSQNGILVSCYGSISGGACDGQGYDALNRPVRKTYNDGVTSPVTWTWDTAPGGRGRLASVSSGISTTSYGGYDGLGRVLVSTQSTAGVDFTFGYTYKPIGLDTITYPSGRQVSNVYDGATGRIQQVSGLLAGLTTNFASGVSYAAHGDLESFQSGNGNFEEHCFDTGRLQTTGVRFGPVGRTGNCFTFGDLLNLRYGYGTSNDNNGNLRRQTITRPQGTQTQWYGYDALNRLTVAAENPSNRLNPICPDSAAAWCQQYGYDPFGNRWVPSSVKLPSTLETPNSAIWYAPNNRIIGWGYDNAGNLTQVGNLYTLGYDAENRQKTAAIGGLTATYQYDGDGRRVQKTVTMGGGSPVTTFFVYDASGELAAEYGLGTETGLHYVTQDALGSPRVRTNADGTVAQNYDYLPFGQEIGAGTANRDNTFSPGIYPAASSIGGSDVRFTGKERDAETGLDYFGARYFSSAQGRFTSPDWSDRPEPIPYADLRDPQTLNLYAYGRNNPLRNRDLDGHCFTHNGEEHNWLWCAAHRIGLVQTKEEVDQTQQELANLGAQEYAKAHSGFDPTAYTQQQIRQMWDNGVFSKTKDDPLDPLQLLGMVTVFRGGPGLNVRSNDVKVDSNGMVQPGRGVSSTQTRLRSVSSEGPTK